jgi:hypothetical protein
MDYRRSNGQAEIARYLHSTSNTIFFFFPEMYRMKRREQTVQNMGINTRRRKELDGNKEIYSCSN